MDILRYFHRNTKHGHRAVVLIVADSFSWRNAKRGMKCFLHVSPPLRPLNRALVLRIADRTPLQVF